MGLRVGDVPQIKTSRGSTKISLEGAWLYGSQPRARERKKKEAHANDASPFNIVYVNEIARTAMSEGRAAKFPAGSIIVSEKLLKPDDAPPELVAVMVKRAAGFNPAAGDWEFLVVNGSLTQVRERHKKGRCAACHASQRENDFVFPLTAAK